LPIVPDYYPAVPKHPDFSENKKYLYALIKRVRNKFLYGNISHPNNLKLLQLLKSQKLSQQPE